MSGASRSISAGLRPERLPRAVAALTGLAGLLLAIVAASLMSGSFPLDLRDLGRTLAGAPPSEMAGTVVWDLRLPRLLAAALVGAMMALSGAILQNVTLNALADPSLVGVSQGAGLAVVGLIVLAPGIDPDWRPIAALGGALAAAALIQTLARPDGGEAPMRFVLTGIGIAAFLSALTSMLLTYGQVDQALSALAWLAGSLHAATWAEARMLGLALLLLAPGLLWAVRPMTAMRMGPEVAASLGLHVPRARLGLTALAVALAAGAVAASGPLGFVGLVAPHLAQRLARSGPGLHLMLSGLTGATLVAGADLIGRSAFAPVQIPAGLVTALVGVPVLVLLLLRSPSSRP